MCALGVNDTTCSTSTTSTAISDDWTKNGWRVFVPSSAQQLALKKDVDENQVTMTTTITTVTFQSSGFPSVGVGDIALQAVGCEADSEENRREITISPAGRITVQTAVCQ